MALTKVISGGQTGVDRAGLDAAMEAGIAVGGFCPKGRKSEDGCIPGIYPLEEMTSPEYDLRTEKNVVESDGTLILNRGPLSEGTKLTFQLTTRHSKPCLVVQLDAHPRMAPAQVANWIQLQGIEVLNVAGPRESKFPGGIYKEAHDYLVEVFRQSEAAD